MPSRYLRRRSHRLRIDDCRLMAGRQVGLYAVGRVSRDLQGADDDAVVIVDWRDRQRNGNQCAVFPLANRIEMTHTLAVSDLREELVFFALAIFGNDHPDRPADRFLSGISENALGRAVPRSNRAIQVIADDSVVGRFDDSCEVAEVDLSSGL